MFLLPAFAAFTLALAVALIIFKFFEFILQRPQKKAIGALSRYAGLTLGKKDKRVKRIDYATIIRSFGNVLVSGKYRKFIQKRLDAAGDHDPEKVQGYVNNKIYYLVAGTGFSLFILATTGTELITIAIAMPLVGFFLPDVLLYNEALKRQDTLGKELSDAIDLLNMCVQSGLSFEAALQRVATSMTGPVAEDFGGLLGEMQLGKTRSEALAILATRTTQQDFLRFITAMSQVDRLGVPVAAVLKEQAQDMRAKRKEAAREMAQKVPIKILAPVMVCFLPAIFVIVVGPAAVSIATSLGSI